MERISHWIGGKEVAGTSGRSGPVSTRRAVSRRTRSTSRPSRTSTPRCRLRKEAFWGWRSTSLSKRADIFFRLRELLDQRKPELARIVSSQHGKVISDASELCGAREPRISLGGC